MASVKLIKMEKYYTKFFIAIIYTYIHFCFTVS